MERKKETFRSRSTGKPQNDAFTRRHRKQEIMIVAGFQKPWEKEFQGKKRRRGRRRRKRNGNFL